MFRFVSAHKTLFLSLGFLVLFSAAVVRAAPPGTTYNPGETLDPACAPGTANCSVTVSAASLTFGTGLTKTSNTVTSNLSTGVTGGQNVIGGTGVGDALSLVGTTGNGTLAAPALNFKVGNNGATTAMTILNNGNVGIGIVSPAGQLTVAGSRSAAQWSTNGIGLQIRASTYTDTSSSGTVANAAVNSMANSTIASSNAVVYTNASTLYIAGAPGAGTNTTITNPWALNVASGNANFAGKTIFGNVAEKVSITTGQLAFNRDVTTGAINDSNGYAYNWSHTKSIVNTGDTLAMQVFSPTGTSVTPAAFVINALGNVGIGTSTPTQALNVAGNIQISGNGNGLYFPDGSFISTNAGGVGVGTTSATDLSFAADSNSDGTGVMNFSVHGTGAMTIANNGFIGINTTSPTQSLTVNGNLQITGTGNGIYFADGSFMGSSANIGTGISAVGDISLVADTDQDTVGTIGMSTGGTQHFLMVNSGNIGIGTSTPSTTMQVNSTTGNGMVVGPTSYPSFMGTNGLYVTGRFYANAYLLNSGSSINWGASQAYILGVSPNLGSASYLTFFTGGFSGVGERMRITDSGNIGIGTTTPNYLLGVGSSLVPTGTIVAEFQNAGGTCDLDPSTTGGLSCASDMTLKKNITTLANNSSWNFNSNVAAENQSVLSRILALTPVDYNWNVESDRAQKHAGFIAQEVRQVFPDLVQSNSNTNTLTLNYTGLVPYTIEAIKEMNVTLKALPTFDDPTLAVRVADFLRGIAVDSTARVDTVEANKICLQGVCLTKDDFQQLLQSKQSSGGGSSAPQTTTSTGDPAPDPDPSPAPDAGTQTPEVAPPAPAAPADQPAS